MMHWAGAAMGEVVDKISLLNPVVSLIKCQKALQHENK